MSDTKECPVCAETIKAAAKKCEHCGELLEGYTRKSVRGDYVDGDRITTGNMSDAKGAAELHGERLMLKSFGHVLTAGRVTRQSLSTLENSLHGGLTF